MKPRSLHSPSHRHRCHAACGTRGANADAISDWNGIAVQATVTGARPGPTGVIDIAMVQAAVYDAVQAIERQFEPYYQLEIPGATGSPVAAAAREPRTMCSSTAFRHRQRPST